MDLKLTDFEMINIRTKIYIFGELSGQIQWPRLQSIIDVFINIMVDNKLLDNIHMCSMRNDDIPNDKIEPNPNTNNETSWFLPWHNKNHNLQMRKCLLSRISLCLHN